MVLFIDNGHGKNTPGKCSPDRSLLEYKWTRDFVAILVPMLVEQGHKVFTVCPEENDVALSVRVHRVNRERAKYKADERCMLISVHVDAATSNGQWSDARGLSVFVAPNASSSSKRFAAIMWKKAVANGFRGNRSLPKEYYKTGNFAIIRDTSCPAVLVENLFMTNRDDVKLLQSRSVMEKLAKTYIAAINEYLV